MFKAKNKKESTGNLIFDELIEKYKKRKPWDDFDWSGVEMNKLVPKYDYWINKAQNCKHDYTFIENENLGMTRNARAVFFRWFEANHSENQNIQINNDALSLINDFVNTSVKRNEQEK